MSNEPKSTKNEVNESVAPSDRASGKTAHIEQMLGSHSYYVVDSKSAFDKFATSLVFGHDQKKVLSGWIEYMKSRPEGLDETLEAFLLTNPDQFRIDDKSQEGATPRALQNFSNMLTKIKNKEHVDGEYINAVMAGVGENFVKSFKGRLKPEFSDYTVDELSQQIDITTRPTKTKVTLDDWLKYMKSTPPGINEGLEKFLLANPEFFKVDDKIEGGLSPREMKDLSGILTSIQNADAANKHLFADALGSMLKAAGPMFVAKLNDFNGQHDDVQITTRPVNYEVTLNEWIEMMEQSENGLNPTLKEFVLKNPDLYNPKRDEGDGITPRSLTLASMILSQPKQGVLVAHTLQDLLGDDVFQRFTKHIETKVQYYNDLMAKMAPRKKDLENGLER